jgi:hypothetical protein
LELERKWVWLSFCRTLSKGLLVMKNDNNC